MEDRIFYISCVGFVLGVLLSSFLFVNLFFALFVVLLALFLIIFFKFVSFSKWGIIIFVFLLTLSLGMVRFGLIQSSASEIFESLVGESLAIEALVVDEPDIRETNQKLTVEVNIESKKTKVLMTTDFIDHFSYGDKLNIVGKLEKPENFITDQGKDFDYINYLRKDGIFFLMSYPEIEIVSHNNGNIVKRTLFYVKDKFVEKLGFAIRSPESLLMGGLILGEKSAFNKELRQDFVDTGTIHIVALSGYNVTIIADWIMKLFSSFPQNFATGAGIFTIFLFVIMTGASSTAIRAGIMASLALFSKVISRGYDVSRALIIAGVLMIFINPLILVFDVSFQLSFIATVAVIYLSPKMERYFLWVPKHFGLRDIASVTTSAYIFVLPFILYKMGNLSLVALFANALIIPFIQPTMIFGFITGFLGIVSYVLAVPFGLVSYLLLHYELFVVNTLAGIPFASLDIPNFPLVFVIAIYVYFTYRLFGRSIKSFFEIDNCQ